MADIKHIKFMKTTPEFKITEEILGHILTQYKGYVGKIYMPENDTTGLQIRSFWQFYVEFRIFHDRIAFVIDGDHYGPKKDFETLLQLTCRQLNISALDFNKIIDKNDDAITLHHGFEQLKEAMLSSYFTELASIYFTDIKNIEVSDAGFKINGVEFRLCPEIISTKHKTS